VDHSIPGATGPRLRDGGGGGFSPYGPPSLTLPFFSLFGYQFYSVGEFSLPISDVEKTFVDMVYFGEMREELVRRFRPRLEPPKLREYLSRYPPAFRRKVLGLLT